MSGLKFLLVCILIKILLSADCLLERFPSELHFSDKLNSPISIDNYVISQYPSYTSDLTPPLTLQRQYSIVNHSQPFVLSVPYPHYIVPIFDQNSVLFEIYDIQTQQLINKTIKYALQGPHKCKFIFLVSYPFDGSSIFTHCTNSTHHHDLIFGLTLSKVQEISTYALLSIQQTQQIFIEWKFGTYPTINSIFFLHKSTQSCQIDSYTYSSSFSYHRQKTCQDIEKESKLKDIRIVDFHVEFNVSTLIIESTGKLLISYFNTQFYSYWFVENDILMKVTSLCQTSLVSVVSSSYLYFISIDNSPNHRLEITLKEISRIKLGFTFDPLKMKLGTVGSYVIISNGEDWKIYYLSNDRVKVMTYKCQIDVSLIYCDEMLCGSNIFYFQNKKYSIQKMKLINNGTASNRNVTLTVSNCNKVIAIKRQNNRQIQEVNAKQSLICRDNEIRIDHQLCSGYNLTQKLVVNLKQYPLTHQKTQFNVEGDVVEYLSKSNFHIILTNNSKSLKLYVFCQNQSDSYSFSLSPKVKKRIITTTTDDSQSDVIILLFFLCQDELIFFYFNAYFNSFSGKLILDRLHHESSLNLANIYQIQLLSFQLQIYIDKNSYDEVITNIPTIKLELIGNCEMVGLNNITHISNFWQRSRSSGMPTTIIEDLFTNYDKYCYIMDNLVIMYKQQANLIKMMIIKDIKEFYQILKKKDIKMNAPYRTQCVDGKLAVFSQNNVNIIDETLQSTLKLELSESTINDIITNNLLIHQSSNSIQVYSLENGFMVRRIPSVGINQVVVSSKSQGILLKNGTLLTLDYQNIFLPSNLDSFAELSCSNEFNSTLKIKKIVGSQTLKLPSGKQLFLPSSKFVDNFWNATIDKVEMPNMNQFNLKTSDEKRQSISHTHEIYTFGFYYGYYLGFFIYDVYVIAGCKHNNYNIINCYIVPLDEDADAYLFKYTKVLVSISNLYNQNSFIMIYQNQTHIQLVKYMMTGTSHNLENQTIACPTSTYLIGQLQHVFHPNYRWTYADGTYLYLYRQNEEDWKSSSQLFQNSYAIYPNPMREKSKRFGKIQVYGLNGQCLLDEITAQMFGVYNKMTDFSMFIRNNQTYLVILCETDVILVKYSYPHNQLTFYKIDLGIKYIKIEAIANYLVLISKNYDHSLYKIYWETFPLGGTLELTKTYIQSGIQDIKGAALSENILITYSVENIYVYHLYSNSSKAYSSERKNVIQFSLDQEWQCKPSEGIDFVKHIQGSKFLISTKGYDCLSHCYFNVSSSIDLKGSDKIALNNRKNTQEYDVEYEQLQQ